MKKSLSIYRQNKIRMKPIALLASTLLFCLFACTPFPTRFERIEDGALRPLDAVFLPQAEAVPSDTLTCRIYFGGNNVTEVTDWRISTDIIMNEYYSDTAVNWQDLDIAKDDSRLPESASVSFIIPDSIMYTSQGVSDQALSMVRQILPPTMQGFSRSRLVDFATELSKIDFNDPLALVGFLGTWSSALGITDISDPATMVSLSTAAAALFNVFSIKGYLSCVAHTADGKMLPIRSRFVIRFNGALRNSPLAAMLPVNRNPVLHWIALVSVAKDSLYYVNLADPKWDSLYTIQYLYNDQYPDSVFDTVKIDTGHTYFFAVDSGITPISISDSTPFSVRVGMTDTATLRLSTPGFKVNYTLYPGDTITDPLIAARMQSAIWYRTKLITPFALMPGDTLIASQGSNLLINTGDTSGLIAAGRSTVTAELITRDFGATFEQTIDMEQWTIMWWYQNLDADKAAQPLDSLLVIQGAYGPMVSFLPPLDTAMHRFQIWVGASDSFLGEVNRPVGKTNKSATGYFKYTQAYIDKHNK